MRGLARRAYVSLLGCAVVLACLAVPAGAEFPYGSGPEHKVGPGVVPNDLAGDDNEFK